MPDFGKFGLHKFGSMFLALILFVGAALMTTRGLQAFPLKYYAHRFGIIRARRAREKDSDRDRVKQLKAIAADLDKFKKNVENDKDLSAGQMEAILDILAKYDSKANKIKLPQVSHSGLGKVVVLVGRTQFLKFAYDVQQAKLRRHVTITVSPTRSAEKVEDKRFGLARSIELAIIVANEMSNKDVLVAKEFLISSVHKMASRMAYGYGVWTNESDEKYETMTFRELSNFLTSKVTVIMTKTMAEAKDVAKAEAKPEVKRARSAVEAKLAKAEVERAKAEVERAVDRVTDTMTGTAVMRTLSAVLDANAELARVGRRLSRLSKIEFKYHNPDIARIEAAYVEAKRSGDKKAVTEASKAFEAAKREYWSIVEKHRAVSNQFKDAVAKVEKADLAYNKAQKTGISAAAKAKLDDAKAKLDDAKAKLADAVVRLDRLKKIKARAEKYTRLLPVTPSSGPRKSGVAELIKTFDRLTDPRPRPRTRSSGPRTRTGGRPRTRARSKSKSKSN